MLVSIVYLIVLLLELVALAVYARWARDILKSSGFEDPSTVERVWSLAREISLQPVAQPFLYALMMHFGAFAVMAAFQRVVIGFVGLRSVVPDLSQNFLVTLVLFAASCVSICGPAFVTLVVYRISGGIHTKSFVAVAIAYPMLLGNIKAFIGLAILELPFYVWAAYKPLPATARPLPSSHDQPQSAGLRHLIFRTVAPLLIAQGFTICVPAFADPDIYIPRLASVVSDLVQFCASAIASVTFIKSTLLTEHYQWQWHAFLISAVPSLCLQIVYVVVSALPDKEYPDANITDLVYSVTGNGCSGVLGAYIYLKLAENAVKAHF